MSLFGEQLQNRVTSDKHLAAVNQQRLGDVISGKQRVYAEDSAALENIRQIERIGSYLGVSVPDKPRECREIDEQIEAILQPSGVTKRRVELSENWWKNGDGPLLVLKKGTNECLALLPDRFRGYCYMDPESVTRTKVTRDKTALFEEDAWCFYKPLPPKALSGKDYIRFLFRQLRRSDLVLILFSVLFVTLFGLLTPFATKYAFANLIPTGNEELLIPLAALLFSAAVGIWMMNVVKVSVMARITSRMEVASGNAVYARVLHLPATFFGGKSAGGLAQRVIALNMIPSLLTQIIFGTCLQILISVIYIVQLLRIASELVLPVFVIYLTEILIFCLTVKQETKRVANQLQGDEKNNGLVFALLSGIQKIKISGSEDRAYAKWLETYRERTKPAYRIMFPSSIRVPLMTAVHLAGLLWIYTIAFQHDLSVAKFAAFSGAFGMVMGGITQLGASGSSISMISPILRIGEPIRAAEPERTEGKKQIKKLSGRIELSQVVFRYNEDGPAILNEVDLKIEPGEYVAIVGKSGCGKSTLFRLILGFEEPQQGAIYFDGSDITSFDRHSLRRSIGTVLQDGKLFAGNIFSNITITAPWMTMEDAWEAAEKAGMAEDIRRMPMGMHTVISEGSGGISGGQKQRLLIARAICPRPGILMFDEATSALDNLTQKVVTDSLNRMDCTRIVIAHRLSTIKECDRILVLDHGKIAEDGTYDELMAKNGLFTELARRQMIEEN